MSNQDHQGELFRIDRTFIRVLFSMVDDGTLARIGVAAFAVLLVVRRYVPISGVHSMPSQETIAQKTWLSRPTVRKALKALVDEEIGRAHV